MISARPALYITVGIPGCGKSTYASKMLANDEIDFVISSDRIREQLTGDITNQDHNNDVFDILNGRVKAGLATGWGRALVDATNLRPSYRAALMKLADEYEAPAFALHFGISANFDECQRRNLTRLRIVPYDVMQRFHRYFVEQSTPSQLLAEGWKVISA